jgi:hypothetical protein
LVATLSSTGGGASLFSEYSEGVLTETIRQELDGAVVTNQYSNVAPTSGNYAYLSGAVVLTHYLSGAVDKTVLADGVQIANQDVNGSVRLGESGITVSIAAQSLSVSENDETMALTYNACETIDGAGFRNEIFSLHSGASSDPGSVTLNGLSDTDQLQLDKASFSPVRGRTPGAISATRRPSPETSALSTTSAATRFSLGGSPTWVPWKKCKSMFQFT